MEFETTLISGIAFGILALAFLLAGHGSLTRNDLRRTGLGGRGFSGATRQLLRGRGQWHPREKP